MRGEDEEDEEDEEEREGGESPYSLDTLCNARKEVIKMRAQRLQSPRIEGDAPAAAGAACGGGGGAGCGRRGD